MGYRPAESSSFAENFCDEDREGGRERDGGITGMRTVKHMRNGEGKGGGGREEGEENKEQ
jgi:hypothetical protein